MGRLRGFPAPRQHNGGRRLSVCGGYVRAEQRMTRHAHWLVDALLLGLTVDLVIVALLGALFALVGMVLAFDGWVIGGSALSVVAFLAANMAATWRQRRRRHDGEPGGEEQYDASRHDQRGGLPARNGAGREQAGHGRGGGAEQQHRHEGGREEAP